MDDIITSFNELLFRAGVTAASWPGITELMDPGSIVHQTVQANLTKEENVFSSDSRWFLGAAAIQILTIVLILPAYWGWWTIGVELTLSPFQTAKAFDAPLFKSINSTAGATGLVDRMGDLRLRLGVVHMESSMDSDVSKRTNSGILSHSRSRIGIAEGHRTFSPRKGARFDE